MIHQDHVPNSQRRPYQNSMYAFAASPQRHPVSTIRYALGLREWDVPCFGACSFGEPNSRSLAGDPDDLLSPLQTKYGQIENGEKNGTETHQLPLGRERT
jgi:hypothetical protein